MKGAKPGLTQNNSLLSNQVRLPSESPMVPLLPLGIYALDTNSTLDPGQGLHKEVVSQNMSNEPVQVPAPPTPQVTVVDFGPQNTKKCSLQICAAGHEWVPQIMAVKCPGCQAPMLALMMVNCPICNEPPVKAFFRMDHIAMGGQITPLCMGSATLAEPIGIEVPLCHAQQEQDNFKEQKVTSKV